MTQRFEDPEVAVVIWRGPLSALVARLRLTATEIHMLKHSVHTQRGILIDVPVANPGLGLAALKRKLEAARLAGNETKRNV